MASMDEGKKTGGDEMSVVGNVKNHVSLQISTSQIGLLMTDENTQTSNNNNNNHGIHERLQRIFFNRMSKEWIKNPLVMVVLLIWMVCVALSGTVLFMVMTGMLSHSLPKKSQRDAWIEVNNQILNGLFTLLCLYLHPMRMYHLCLLVRWKPADAVLLRKIYCKNGSYKPNERFHMMVVVILLNLNCFAQYAVSGLNWGYSRVNRPAVGVGICISVAIASVAFAGVYIMLSPLRKDWDSGDMVVKESQVEVAGQEVNIFRPEPIFNSECC